MKRNILLALGGVVLLLGVGVGAYWWGTSQAAGGTPSAASQQAAQQFFAERAGTPGVVTNTISIGVNGTPGPGGPPPGAVGMVDKVDGNQIVVKHPMDGSTTTIQVGPKTTVHKAVAATVADIKPGVHLTAVGQQSGDAIQALTVDLGDAGGALMGGPVQFQANGGDAPLTMPQQVAGTVTAVAGQTVTLQTADGKPATVQLTADTQIHKPQVIDVLAIQPGDLVFAQGSQAGAVFAATDIQVSSGDQMMFGTKP